MPEQGVAAAAASYDILVRFVHAVLRTLAMLGLVVALGGYLAGPSAGAVQIRSALGRVFTCLGRGRVGRALRSGPVGRWVHPYCGLLRGAAVGLAALVFVLLDQPTGRDVLLVALGLVLVLGAIEFLGQQPRVADARRHHPRVMPRRGRVGSVGQFGVVMVGRSVRCDDGAGDLSRSSSWLRGSRQRQGRLPDSARSTAAGRIASTNG